MKSYPISAIPEDAWKSIEFLFQRCPLDCLPAGTSGDGFDVGSVETNKHGVEISGVMTFLKGGGKRGGSMLSYKMKVCLMRPTFSSVSSVTTKKVEEADVVNAIFQDNVLVVSVK